LNLLLLYFFLDNIKLKKKFLGMEIRKIKKVFNYYEFKNKN